LGVQGSFDLKIARAIASKLWPPILLSICGPLVSKAAVMLMPKATVNQNDFL
jgi:hypothetical protein